MTAKTYMPPPVWTAAALTPLLAVYADVMSVLFCINGLFGNFQIFIFGVVHASIGAVLLVAWRGLLHRRRWSRWLLVLISGLVAMVLPIWTAQECLQAGSIFMGALFVLIIAVLFALITLNLSSPSASVWFKK
jgi:hypothetical protein